MFSRVLTESLTISLSIPQYSDELFTLIDRNRMFLRRWLPWLDGTLTPEDTRQFLALQLQRFARGESLHVTIFSGGSIAGVAGFNSLDRTNGIGYIGYWLGEEFTGKGIMTPRLGGHQVGPGADRDCRQQGEDSGEQTRSPHRQPQGMVGPLAAETGNIISISDYSGALNDTGMKAKIPGGWRQKALRHSFISYRVAASLLHAGWIAQGSEHRPSRSR